MKQLEAHSRYLAITGVIANLENKLLKAKDKNPNLDLSEQEGILAILRDYHIYCMEVEEENRITDKKYIKMANRYDYIFNLQHELAQENKKLEKEIKILKESIE